MAFLLCLRRKKKSKSKTQSLDSGYVPFSPILREPDDDLDDANDQADSNPDRLSFELPRQNFILDRISDQGLHCVAYTGQIHTASGAVVPATIKTTKSSHRGSVQDFKALFMELKILATIGPHENIVNLIAAHTANLRQGVLYIGLELCSVSLLSWVRTRRGAARQFGRWAAEIAAGMEFLSEKRVVHRDLALRNIWLSSAGVGPGGGDPTLHAKIGCLEMAHLSPEGGDSGAGDFDVNTAIAWAWAAPECLTHMEFSTASDVWAFGVTIWEMATFGEVPYSEGEWSFEFLEQLRGGLRPRRPVNVSNRVNNMMQSCWSHDPLTRPTFTELKHFFQSIEPEEFGIPRQNG